jgi:hypothetical protein
VGQSTVFDTKGARERGRRRERGGKEREREGRWGRGERRRA